MTLFVDTSVWSLALRRDAGSAKAAAEVSALRDALEGGQEIVTTGLVLQELLQGFSVRECLGYVLSLPIHCTAVGCTTPGQLEDDVRVARGLRPLDAGQMAALRARAEPLKGSRLEDWKRNVEPAVGLRGVTPYKGG